MIGTRLPHRMQLSPNVGERKAGQVIDCLILHYTGMSDAVKACDWLCNGESEVSCHYLVDEQGGIVQMVDENARAWHAGVSSWLGEDDMNSASIGIEIQNPGHFAGYPDFPQAQMLAVIALCKDVIGRHAIPARRVLAHSDVAPGRKIDPGEKFDWSLLHQHGVGHWVEPEQISAGTYLQWGDEGDAVMTLQAKLKMVGYGIEVNSTYDQRTKIVVEAFQRHFRTALVDGIADQSTVVTLRKVLRD